jgi:hypothetical protein
MIKASSKFCAYFLLLYAAYIMAGSAGGHVSSESSGCAGLYDVG